MHDYTKIHSEASFTLFSSQPLASACCLHIPGTVLDVVEIVTLIVTLVRRYVLSPPCLSMYESLNSC